MLIQSLHFIEMKKKIWILIDMKEIGYKNNKQIL